MKILLYTAIPEHEQFRPLVLPPFQRAKSAVRHAINRARTRLSGQFHIDIFHYQTANNLDDNSNRGDIAIRLAVRQQLLDVLGPAVEFIELKWGELTDQTVDRINRECDLFVIAGGGYIFINSDGSGGHRFSDVSYLQKIRCPVIAYGIGMNRLMHEEVRDLRDLPAKTRNLVADFRRACRLAGVRDAQTLDLLTLYGTQSSSLIGDPVLFLRGTPASGAVRETRRPVVGINFAAHGWRSIAVLKPLLPKIVVLLKHVQSKYGVTFRYLFHHDFEEVVVSFLRQHGIQFDLVRHDTMPLFESYGDLDFVICQMLHSCIFAANHDIPFLNIAYDHKNVAFCDLLGIPQCTLAHGDATADVLKARFDELFAARNAIKKTIAAGKAPLKEAQREFMHQLAGLAERENP